MFSPMISKINHFQDINVGNSNTVTILVPNNNITHNNTTTINTNNLLSSEIYQILAKIEQSF